MWLLIQHQVQIFLELILIQIFFNIYLIRPELNDIIVFKGLKVANVGELRAHFNVRLIRLLKYVNPAIYNVLNTLQIAILCS